MSGNTIEALLLVKASHSMGLTRVYECWQKCWYSLRVSGGRRVVQQAGEGSATSQAVRCTVKPLAEAQEVQASRDEDVAAVGLWLPTVARMA